MVSDSENAEQTAVHVKVYDTKTTDVLVSCNGIAGRPFQCAVESPKVWSPDSPTLYNISVTFGADEISSYIGFRTISSRMVNGVVRPLLNDKPLFMFGTLDQGYWPDGLYTPPNREAMIYDIEVLKNLGFNMLRKHVSRLPGMNQKC
jgi:beta-galactosidase/beta-glucuronidase